MGLSSVVRLSGLGSNYPYLSAALADAGFQNPISDVKALLFWITTKAPTSSDSSHVTHILQIVTSANEQGIITVKQALYSTGHELSNWTAEKSRDADAVHYTEQTLTEAQQQQARKNIGLDFASKTDVMTQPVGIDDDGKLWTEPGVILSSSTEGSTKKFRIAVDDTGTLSAKEITET